MQAADDHRQHPRDPRRDEGEDATDVELIGGPEQRELVLAAPDAGWAPRARDLLAQVRSVLPADGSPARLAHIGSTAVPHLPAKPIVDLQLAVPDVADEGRYLPHLERAGYRLRVRERRGRHRMVRSPERDVHLHVWDLGSDEERRHLLFRDHLRHHTDDRDAYAQRKRELVERTWPTMQHYADAKSDLVERILARAEGWAARTGWDVTTAADLTLGSGAVGHAP